MKDLYQNFIVNKKNIFQIKEKINDNIQLLLNLRSKNKNIIKRSSPSSINI